MKSLGNLKAYAGEKVGKNVGALRSKLPELPELNLRSKLKNVLAATLAAGAFVQTIDAQAPQNLVRAHLSNTKDDSAHVKMVNTNDFKPASPFVYDQSTNTVVIPRDTAKPSPHTSNNAIDSALPSTAQVLEQVSSPSDFQQNAPASTLEGSAPDERLIAASLRITEEKGESLMQQNEEIQNAGVQSEKKNKSYAEVQAEMRMNNHSVVELELGFDEDGKTLRWTQKSMQKVSPTGEITPEERPVFKEVANEKRTRFEQAEDLNVLRPSPGPILVSLPGEATLFEDKGGMRTSLSICNRIT